MKKRLQHVLRIDVYDSQRRSITDASVLLEWIATAPVPISYPDSRRVEKQREGGYRCDDVYPGRYRITVTREGFQSEWREIDIAGGRPVHLEILLGRTGALYYHDWNGQNVPVDIPEHPCIVVSIDAMDDPRKQDVESILRSYHLERVEPEGMPDAALFLLYRFTSPADRREADRVLSALASVPGGCVAFPFIEYGGGRVHVLTNKILVGFKSLLTDSDIYRELAVFGLEVIEKRPSPISTYVVSYGTVAGYGVIEMCGILYQSGLVEFAVPVFQDDRSEPLSPGDFLYPEEWTATVARLPEAWSVLRAIDADREYGSPSIILGVMDFGMQTVPGPSGYAVPAHPDFIGQVSNGDDKIYGFYDFRRRRPDHHLTYNVAPSEEIRRRHGTNVAGVCSPVVDNSRGVAGAAGNARLLALRLLGGQVANAEALRWAFGLIPFWSKDAWNSGYDSYGVEGVPLPLTDPSQPLGRPTPRGADLINNSYTSQATDLDASAAANYNLIVQYGRKGRGGLLIFGGTEEQPTSVSNIHMNVQFAARSKSTIIVNASGIFEDGAGAFKEERAHYAGYGRIGQPTTALDFCAPTGGVATGNRHEPPAAWGHITADIVSEGDQPGGPGVVDTLFQGVVGSVVRVDDTVFELPEEDDKWASGLNKFYAGQPVLIGDPGPDALYRIYRVLSPTTVQLDRTPVARTNGMLFRGMSELKTKLSAPSNSLLDTIQVDSSEDILANQKIVIGNPALTGSEVLTVAADPTVPGTLTLTTNPAKPHAANDPVYLLGGGSGRIRSSTVYRDMAERIIEVDNASGFVAEQHVLIGDPGPDSVYTVERSVSSRRLQLDRAPVGISTGDKFQALSLKMTELDSGALLGALSLLLESAEGFLPGQKIVIGDPALSTSEVVVVASRAGATINLPVGTTKIHAKGDGVYFLGGPAGSTTLETVLDKDADSGDNWITVKTTAGMAKNHALLIGTRGGLNLHWSNGILVTDSGTVAAESHRVAEQVSSPVELKVLNGQRDLISDHPMGRPVVAGAPNYRSTFTGTSAAAPLATGIAALVLSANMEPNGIESALTWWEVRDILRTTADRIDVMNEGNKAGFLGIGETPGYFIADDAVGSGKWLDRSGGLIVDDGGDLHIVHASTTLLGVPPAGAVQIKVASTVGFEAGHAIAIGDESVRIRRVHDDGVTLDITQLHAAPGTSVVNTGSTTLTSGAASGDIQLSVADSRGFAPGQTILLDNEVRCIVGIINSTQILLDSALRHAHAINTPVNGGRIPYYSHWYGFGRLNAERAVIAARDYSHNHRDLMIRNNADDDGTASATPIDSPDLWVRTIDPAAEPPAAYTTSLDIPVPHQVPDINQSKWLCARIHNRGTARPNLPATVRFFIALSPDRTPTFRFPEDWPYDRPVSDLYLPGATGSYLIGEAQIEADTIEPSGSPYGPSTLSTAVEWLSPPSTFARTNNHCFLLVQISPHDGAMNDADPASNNNLTYRYISFTAVRFENGSNERLQGRLDVNRTSSDTAVPFTVRVANTLNYFKSRTIALEITRVPDSGADETVLYTYDVGSGQWVADQNYPWLTLAQPVRPDSNPPLVNDFEVVIPGSLAINYTTDRVRLSVVVRDGSGDVEASGLHTLVVSPSPLGYSAGTEIVETGRPRFHVFADMDRIVQPEELAFGPKSQTRFRTTSSFDPIAPGQTINAYAATTGTVFLQRVYNPDGSLNESSVNLILRPLRQSKVGFTPVKYFIYRGLNLSDFLTVESLTKSTVRPKEGASEFITALYTHHEARIAAMLAQDAAADVPGSIPDGRALGWDQAAQQASDLLDSYFFRSDTSFQLPIVRRGMVLGTFNADEDFGFEIVLEQGHARLDLEYARTLYNEIDLNVTGETGLAAKRRREDVLDFIDPAAYYGMHYDGGVEAVGGEIVKEEDLYNQVVAVFHTRNKLYLDIRSENGYSLDFYGNYTPDDGGPVKVGPELATEQFRERRLSESGWPILILDDLVATNETRSTVYLAFRFADNANPVVYIEYGDVFTRHGERGFIADEFLVGSDAVWTKEMGLAVPNTMVIGPPAFKRYVAGALKLHYMRQGGTTEASPDTVVRTDRYTDNLFGPIDVAPLWETDDQIEWISSQGKRFVDRRVPSETPYFAYMGERSVAVEPGRVIFYTSAIQYLDDLEHRLIAERRIKGGHSSRGGFLEASSLFDGLNVQTRGISDTPPGGESPVSISVPYLVRDVGSDVEPRDVLLLGISTDQHNALRAAGEELSPYHEQNIALVERFASTVAGNEFVRYKAVVRGLSISPNLDGVHTSADALPSQAVYVYSVDDLFFTSSDFGPLQDLIAYEPQAEEKVAEVRPEAARLIGLSSAIADDVNDFAAEIGSVDDDDAEAGGLLLAKATSYGATLLDHARAFAGSHGDDRPLYWARLKMAVALKRHPYYLKSSADRDAAVRALEKASRGYGAEYVSGGRKVLVLGFDPYALSPDVTRKNVAGVVALALHNQTVGGTDKLFSAVLPVRYRDFDEGLVAGDGAGIIEEMLAPYLTSPDAVDMIVVLAENGMKGYIDVERFAARTRGGEPDNEDKRPGVSVGTGPGWVEYYENSLPLAIFDGLTIPATPQFVYYDQGVTYQVPVSPAVIKAHPRDGGTNSKTTDPSITIPPAATVLDGSGRNYLFNEAFYRLAHARVASGSDTVIGMLSIPAPENTAAPAMTMTQIIDKVKELIGNALSGL